MILQHTHWQIITFVTGTILTALVLAVGHWFPWIRRLGRIQAYTYGVASIVAGFATWRLLNNDWLSVAGLATISIVGGITVIGAYRIDAFVIAVRQAHKTQECDKELHAEPK